MREKEREDTRKEENRESEGSIQTSHVTVKGDGLQSADNDMTVTTPGSISRKNVDHV